MAHVPFDQPSELKDSTGPQIPNNPSILLTNNVQVEEFLKKELSCVTLDEIHPYMHYVARKSGDHVDPLHLHVMKGRTIVVTEDPGQHLVWYYKEIYLKPIPHCLLSHAFWQQHLADDQTTKLDKSSLRRAAMGFIRTYAYLIEHESDFEIAKASKLIPEKVLYNDFQKFIEHFRGVLEDDVSPRWEFGQLRLTRLNWAVRLLQPPSRKGKGCMQRLYYAEQYWQTGQFLEVFGAPLLFLFATFSLILSAMQVVLAAFSNPWAAFKRVSWGFSVAVLILIAVMFFLIIAIIAGILFAQLVFAWRSGRKAAKKKKKAKK